MNAQRYAVWASLAADYLSVMGSSVPSERAFSAAGIVITKRRNRLGADIVEALQFLKCLYRTDLLFQGLETVVDDDEGGFLEGLDLDDISDGYSSPLTYPY
jgi:hypothetical protein